MCQAGAQLEQQPLKPWLTLSSSPLARSSTCTAPHTGLSPLPAQAQRSCCPLLPGPQGWLHSVPGDGDESPAAEAGSGWSPGTMAAAMGTRRPHTQPGTTPQAAHPTAHTRTQHHKSARNNNLAGTELGFYSPAHFSRDSRKKKQLGFWDSTSSKTRGGKLLYKSKIRRTQEVWNIKS